MALYPKTTRIGSTRDGGVWRGGVEGSTHRMVAVWGPGDKANHALARVHN